MDKKMKKISVNFVKGQIELSENFAKKAGTVGSAEYHTLVSVQKEYPEYKIEVLKNKKSIKGIDTNFMRNYIINHDESANLLTDFEKLIEMINILKDEQVTPMMIFKHNEELVISANQILVTLGGKYKDQLKKIKKIIEKLPIRSEAELKFSATELIQMMKGYEGPRIKEIMNILLNKVVNLEILNNNSLIRQEALKIVSDLEHKDKKVKEKELDTETMLSVNPLDKNVIPDTVVKEDDVDSLKRDYLLDFKNMFNMFMQDIPGYSEMSDSKKQEIAREVKAKVKESLLATNSKYKKLSEKGIIK